MEHPLRAYRAQHGLSLDAFAEKVGVAKSTISRIETGEANPSLDLMRRIDSATCGAVSPNALVAAFTPTLSTEDAA